MLDHSENERIKFAVYLFTTVGSKKADDTYDVKINFTSHQLFKNLKMAQEYAKANPQSLIIDLSSILLQDYPQISF